LYFCCSSLSPCLLFTFFLKISNAFPMLSAMGDHVGFSDIVAQSDLPDHCLRFLP
jgi:hypothetical protein